MHRWQRRRPPCARTLSTERDDPLLRFRLGVALRMRYDSDQRRPDDFAGAVAAWTQALAADPNQYIWRRSFELLFAQVTKSWRFEVAQGVGGRTLAGAAVVTPTPPVT